MTIILALLGATILGVAVFFAMGGHRRLADRRASRQQVRDFEQLTRSATLEFRWADQIALSRSHLFVVGALDLSAPGDVWPPLSPSRFRLETIEEISQKRIDDVPLLTVTVLGRDGQEREFGQFFPDRAALVQVYDAIKLGMARSRTDQEAREFEAFVAGAKLDYRWGNELGIDRDTLYAIRFQPAAAGQPLAEFLPPTRLRLRDLREISQLVSDSRGFVVLSFVDETGREYQVCRALPDRASCATVYDEIRARAFRADPPTPANAPTPLEALLRTIAGHEIDARRFAQRFQQLDPEVDTAIWKLRECAEPEAVFMIDWKGEPDREARFTRLFAAWHRSVSFSDTADHDMPEFLMLIRDAATQLGLKLWSIDTRSDFYQGFLTPIELEDRVRELCRECEIVVYD